MLTQKVNNVTTRFGGFKLALYNHHYIHTERDVLVVAECNTKTTQVHKGLRLKIKLDLLFRLNYFS